MRQRWKGLLVEPMQSVSCCSTENQQASGNWRVVAVVGRGSHIWSHGSSYTGHMLYRKVITTVVIRARGSKLGLTE